LDGVAVLFARLQNIVEFGLNKLLKEPEGQQVNVGVELSILIAKMSRRESFLQVDSSQVPIVLAREVLEKSDGVLLLVWYVQKTTQSPCPHAFVLVYIILLFIID